MDFSSQKYIDDYIQLHVARTIGQIRDNYESLVQVHLKRIEELMEKNMQLAQQKEPEEERPAPQLYAVTGEARPPGYNWLSGLSEGTVFLCRPIKGIKDKPRLPFLEQYHVVHQFERSTYLQTNLNQVGNFIVDPQLFCAIMELHEIILRGEDIEQPYNGESDRSD